MFRLLLHFIISFTDFDIYALGNLSTVRFIGLNNYLNLFDDPLFFTALKNTFYFVIVAAPLSIAVSLGAALFSIQSLLSTKQYLD